MSSQTRKVIVRLATVNDLDLMWKIFKEVIQNEDTYDYSSNTSRETFETDWFYEKLIETYVVTVDENIAGIYELKPNRRDLGSHIANASFMIDENYRGVGLGKTLGKHALARAKEKGFSGMQFNFVVSTNVGAIKLWESLGFAIIGTIPHAYKHKLKGLVDAHIMFKEL